MMCLGKNNENAGAAYNPGGTETRTSFSVDWSFNLPPLVVA